MLVVIIFIFTSLLPTFSIKLGIDFPIASIYVGYFILGYFISLPKTIKWIDSHLRYCRIDIILLITTFLIMIFGMLMKIYKGLDIKVIFSSYNSIFTVLQSGIIFYLCMRKEGRFDRFCNSLIIRRFNRCSLGIYITHMVWINFIIKVLHLNIMTYGLIGIITIGLSVFLLAWITTELLIKLPVLREFL